MKKLLTILLLTISAFAMAQYIQTVPPGNTAIISNFAIAGIGGTDTSFKFRMPNGCSAYSIAIVQTDTIEADADISAWLYGSNTGARDVQVGDTLILADDAPTQVDYWTGTTFPYAIGIIRIRKLTTTDGDVTIWLNYY